MTTIAEHEADVARLQRELDTAKENLHQARIVLTGVAVGDVVRGTGRLAGETFRVTGYRYIGSDGKYKWLEGNPQCADGSFGTVVRRLYDYWERM